MIYNWHQRHKDQLSFGDKAADKMRDILGSWTFTLGLVVFMVGWMGWNKFAPVPYQFDAPPFIGLNLILSSIAGVATGVLLIAARRQDSTSAALAQHDYDVNVTSRNEIENLQKELARIEDSKLDKIISLLEGDTNKEVIKRVLIPKK